jgi:hypothetical protein
MPCILHMLLLCRRSMRTSSYALLDIHQVVSESCVMHVGLLKQIGCRVVDCCGHCHHGMACC